MKGPKRPENGLIFIVFMTLLQSFIPTHKFPVFRKWIKVEVENEVMKMEKVKYSCNFSQIS